MNQGDKDFDTWNSLKKSIHARNDKPTYFPKEGEVWMSSLGKNIGYEQNGGGRHFSRPVLIVKKFNNQMFWSTPLSTKQKPFDFYFNFTDPQKEEVSVILAQLKLMSVKRLRRKLYEIDSTMLLQIKAKLQEFLT